MKNKTKNKEILQHTMIMMHLFFLSRKNWLKNEGSPKSRIDRCVFKDEKEIASFDFNEFTIKR